MPPDIVKNLPEDELAPWVRTMLNGVIGDK